MKTPPPLTMGATVNNKLLTTVSLPAEPTECLTHISIDFLFCGFMGHNQIEET